MPLANESANDFAILRGKILSLSRTASAVASARYSP
jgi:hypothetical protein